jgi:phage terminase small subunit
MLFAFLYKLDALKSSWKRDNSLLKYSRIYYSLFSTVFAQLRHEKVTGNSNDQLNFHRHPSLQEHSSPFYACLHWFTSKDMGEEKLSITAC